MKISIILFNIVFIIASSASANSDYYIDHLELEEAWKLSRGSKDTTIAVLDSGVNYRLPELSGKIELDPIYGAYGFDATTDTYDPMDFFGSGTQMASLIVSDELGVAPDSKIVPINILHPSAHSTSLVILKALRYAISRRVDIILLAIGMGNPSKSICNALRDASNAGILIVASAGNDAKKLGPKDYPTVCNINNMIVVTATDKNKNLAEYSSYSFRNVHTAAPGEKISTISHTGSLVTGRGSSYSAALTAGVASLIWSHNPNYSTKQVREALIRGAIRTKGLLGKVTSNGILSAYKSMIIKVEK